MSFRYTQPIRGIRSMSAVPDYNTFTVNADVISQLFTKGPTGIGKLNSPV